jgi:hypothetical protein
VGLLCPLLAFKPLLRGLFSGRKGPFDLTVRTVGPLVAAHIGRAVTTQLTLRLPLSSLARSRGRPRAGEHSKPHPRPVPQAGASNPLLPILPIIIPHLPPKVKHKIYIHMQIPPKARNRKALGSENSLAVTCRGTGTCSNSHKLDRTDSGRGKHMMWWHGPIARPVPPFRPASDPAKAQARVLRNPRRVSLPSARPVA